MEIKEPAENIIVLKQIEKVTETPGGIVLPQNVTQVANSDKVAVVENIGASIDCVEVGDVVVFSHAFATVVNFGDQVRIFVKAGNILATLEGVV